MAFERIVKSKMHEWTLLADEEKVQMLTNENVYPGFPSDVEVIETHLSWVFLTKQFAYKLRKPIRYGFLDYTNLEARRQDAQEEVRQNRRLAKDLYYGVVPVNLSPDQSLKIRGPGVTVEWMIEMRRLPADRMMDYLIRKRALTSNDVRNVGAQLAQFYRNTMPALTDAGAYVHRLLNDISLSHHYLSDPATGLAPDLVEALYIFQLDYLTRQEVNIGRRASEGHILDGHGDLRPEHICIEVGKSPVIFDCLQFSSDLRAIDPVDELSFLSMEAERIGCTRLDKLLLEDYRRRIDDSPEQHLLSFYKTYRAYLWARLAIWRTQELEKPSWTKWIRRANEYLQIAAKTFIASGMPAFRKPSAVPQLTHSDESEVLHPQIVRTPEE